MIFLTYQVYRLCGLRVRLLRIFSSKFSQFLIKISIKIPRNLTKNSLKNNSINTNFITKSNKKYQINQDNVTLKK